MTKRMKRFHARRFIRRDEQGHGGGGGQPQTQQQPQNNGGGDSGESQNGGQQSNNSGQSLDYSGFWQDPEAAQTPEPGSQTQQQSNQQQQPNLGQQLNQQITDFNVGDIFTRDVAQQIADGDMSGVNQALVTMSQQVMRQGLAMNVQVMRQFGESFMAQMRQEMRDFMSSRDNESSLESAFPTIANDPGARQTVESVFNQSMKHTGGDRKKAIAMTKDMLGVMGKKLAPVMGFQNAPQSSEDSFMGEGPASLVAELLGRS
jgi:hypothetical protein